MPLGVNHGGSLRRQFLAKHLTTTSVGAGELSEDTKENVKSQVLTLKRDRFKRRMRRSFLFHPFFYLGNIKTPCANSACHSVQLPRIGFCHEGNRVSWQLLVL